MTVGDRVSIGCNVIATTAPGDRDLVVDDSIAFASAKTTLETTPDPDRAGWEFAKAGLEVLGGRTWSLTVPGRQSRHLALGWGSPPAFGREVRDRRGCSGGDGWSTFPGGFQVDRAGCYPIDVVVDGSTTRVRVGIGASCD